MTKDTATPSNIEVILWANKEYWLVINSGTKENPQYLPIGKIDRVLKAVNSHEKLVEALIFAKETLKTIGVTRDTIERIEQALKEAE